MVINISKDVSGRIAVSFPYAPQLVEKVMTIEGANDIFLSCHCETRSAEAISRRSRNRCIYEVYNPFIAGIDKVDEELFIGHLIFEVIHDEI